MAIANSRNVSTSTHLTPELKDALRRASHERGLSMSMFITQAVKEKLDREGVAIEAPVSTEYEPPLPFEGENDELSNIGDASVQSKDALR
jgi:hypothetical protein